MTDQGSAEKSIKLVIQCESEMVIGPYRLMLDESFVRFIQSCFIKPHEVKTLANACLNALTSLGYLHQPRTVAMVYDVDIPHPEGLVMGWQPCAATSNDLVLDGMVVAFEPGVGRQRDMIAASCARRPRNARLPNVKGLIRGTFGTRLAHELAHCFGVDRDNQLSHGMPDHELDLLADVIAGTSANDLFGDLVWMGTPYIHAHLKAKGAIVDPLKESETFARDYLKSLTHA